MSKRTSGEARVLAAESAAASPGGAELDDDTLDALLPSEGFVTLPAPGQQHTVGAKAGSKGVEAGTGQRNQEGEAAAKRSK
jgi:hypothetical protein